MCKALIGFKLFENELQENRNRFRKNLKRP